MNPRDSVKKLMLEADVSSHDKEAENILKALFENSDVHAQHEAPAGYEEHLIQSLRQRLEVEGTQAASQPKTAQKRRNWIRSLSERFRSPGLAWSFSGAMAVAFFALLFKAAPWQTPTNAKNDLLAQTAAEGGEEVVRDWLAAMGDTGTRFESSQHNLHAFVGDLEEMSRRSADRALREVAASVGLKL